MVWGEASLTKRDSKNSMLLHTVSVIIAILLMKLRLTENMLAHLDPLYTTFLMKIGLYCEFAALISMAGKDGNSSSAKGKKKEVKKETGLGLSNKKDENFGEWYSEVVVNGEMIEYYDISGCYILRPWAMSIWEVMQTFFDAEIKKMKIKNCYFPLFVSSNVLQKEKDHIEGFAPEVAWVTKSGESELEMPIAIRPTSETVMYPYFSKWIRGHRDLPLRLNQWCNVVRWEFSNPTPFIRSREFLWQEGHTAFATKEEADTEVLDILELYRRIYEEFLAVPVIKGKKSEHEKFAGGLYTTTVEAFVPNTGRGVQGATSHCLGQNFAKMFEINFENEKGEKAMVWQNSWAYTTRTGFLSECFCSGGFSKYLLSALCVFLYLIFWVMIMVHGDDKGLVLPPKVASLQVIVVPVPYKDANTQGIFDACAATVKSLDEAGIRAEADFRDNYSPGWKYSNWELKGVPLRIEIGPKDLANNQVRAVRRDNSAKIDIPMADLVERVKEMLNNIQQSLFDVAKQKRDACIQVVRTWEEFVEALGQKKMILAPWCDEEEVEKDVKARTKGDMGAAKSLCSPFDQPELPEGTLCFASGKPAKKWTYWGRSY
ncbi:prolinetRNA ligase [Striga asiatica]|uniref:proline--tRNA ligase n=1 Tax=Striga asiatica TaxID=4170 RepID=A0A5A7PUY2_STRAF|nr:prolinetRNA ligase [Striga asiatica]